jgi:antitoxin component YwqK of YwqJK toxin-antitoxin module
LIGCGRQPQLKELTNNWPNGQIREMWHENDAGYKHGKAITYHLNGQKSTEAEFVNGYLHGEFKMWDKAGNLLSDGVYKDGEPWNGKFIMIDEFNQKVNVKEYVDGKVKP